MNALKFKIGQGLTLSNATAYIVISSLTITDMVGNPVIGISSAAALSCGLYVPDTTPPDLVEFSLDLTAETIAFTLMRR